jgi:hypothetical protein
MRSRLAPLLQCFVTFAVICGGDMETAWKLPCVVAQLFFFAPVNAAPKPAVRTMSQVAVGARHHQCQVLQENGVIRRQGKRSTLEASGTSPLAAAIATLYREYQWIVDYEEPVFTSSVDLCAFDVEHGFPGLLVAGTSFRSTYPTPNAIHKDGGKCPQQDRFRLQPQRQPR